MGKVFTWDEVRNRRVPTIEDFSIVYRRLRTVLEREPSILAAGVCGSVIRGDHTRRSDIDCVVIFDAAQTRAAYSTMQALSVEAYDRHVPLAFVENDSRIAKTRMHHLGPSFVEHMRFSMKDGGHIKGDPFSMLAESVSRQAGIEEWLRFKMHYLQAHWAAYRTFTEADRAAFLQKVLEAPLHIARKVLSWAGPLDGDSKQYIQYRYGAEMTHQLCKALEHFVSIDKSYTVELETQLEQPSELDYLAMLARIEHSVPDVLDFMSENLVHIDQAAP